MNITKAVIAAAGYGTRFLPYTKSIQKEMLPVLNRPLIDYIVEDCLKAGIKEIIFVINKSSGRQIREYYSENKNIYNYLVRMNKLEKYNAIKNIHTKAKFTFVEQEDKGEYGTAVPLKLVEQYVKNEEAFLMFLGDDFIYNKEEVCEAARMIKLFQDSKAKALVTCVEVDKELVSKYGIIEFQKNDQFKFLTNFVEKPTKAEAPSNLANISKYIFTPLIFEYLAKQKVNQLHGELLIIETVLAMSQDHKAVVYTPNGQYLDCGYLAGWLKANIILAKDDPELNQEINNLL